MKCDVVVIGAGAWTPKHWEWLGNGAKLDLKYKDGRVAKDHDMWTYWRLLEGEVYLPEGADFRTAQDRDSPVLQVELMNTRNTRSVPGITFTFRRERLERVRILRAHETTGKVPPAPHRCARSYTSRKPSETEARTPTPCAA